VRRAPVLSSAGELTGVLSIDDIVEHLATQLDSVAETIRHQQRIESKQIT